MWRDGYYLVVLDQTTSPQRCAKCNRPTTEPPIKQRFEADRGRGLIGAAISKGIDAVTGQVYTGPVDAKIHLCRAHRWYRKAMWIGILVVLLVSAGWGWWAVEHNTGRNDMRPLVPCGLATLSLLVMVWLGSNKMNPWFTPKRFHDRYVWLEGADPKFLNSLPSLPPPQPENFTPSSQR